MSAGKCWSTCRLRLLSVRGRADLNLHAYVRTGSKDVRSSKRQPIRASDRINNPQPYACWKCTGRGGFHPGFLASQSNALVRILWVQSLASAINRERDFNTRLMHIELQARRSSTRSYVAEKLQVTIQEMLRGACAFQFLEFSWHWQERRNGMLRTPSDSSLEELSQTPTLRSA
ncbi:hypothetical protein BKA80DRAFT_89914 [Phyllosticta citrichinensis]